MFNQKSLFRIYEGNKVNLNQQLKDDFAIYAKRHN